tara:strand:+ start:2172 stop:2435 length:264 start_codon:yes stop_codon:yes gene_type:complete
MPRYKKHSHQIPENFRRKCEDTQSVKQVQHRYISLPTDFSVKGKKNIHDFTDIPGAVVKNYSSLEGVPEDMREEFVNSYRPEDFFKL